LTGISPTLFLFIILSYQTFALMMTQAAQDRSSDPDNDNTKSFEENWEETKSSFPSHVESKGVNDVNPKYLSDLIAMGFAEELARVVLENCAGKPLHELVAILSDMQEVCFASSHFPPSFSHP
jgi:hypothetical protein